MKDHVKNAKIDYSPKKIKSNDENVHKIQQKKRRIKIMANSMVNNTEVRGMNKTNQFRMKVRRYPGASSIDIIDHLQSSLTKHLMKPSSMQGQAT